jgi:NCS1 family nucleobase:cation symporter-1
VTVTICATLGAFATSAINDKYGKLIWNPISVLQFLLEDDYNASTRAGCFFAGMGFFISQVATNLVQNSVSCGMDLAALAPRWIDVTRGSLIMCLVGYLINPWRFVNAPGTFITVLSSFGMVRQEPVSCSTIVDNPLILQLVCRSACWYKRCRLLDHSAQALASA